MREILDAIGAVLNHELITCIGPSCEYCDKYQRDCLKRRKERATQAILALISQREQGMREALEFAIRLAKVFDESRDSHVYFYIQQAYKSQDMEWEEVQELLNRIIKIDTALKGEGNED